MGLSGSAVQSMRAFVKRRAKWSSNGFAMCQLWGAQKLKSRKVLSTQTLLEILGRRDTARLLIA